MFNLFKKHKDSKVLADKASKTNDAKAAVELYSEAIKLEKEKPNPDNIFLSNLYTQRGEIYLNNGVAILSSSDFLIAIECNPLNGISHNNLGIWYTIEHFTTPDFIKAIDHLEKAVQLCPNRQDFKMNLAVIKIKKGDKAIGRQELEQLLKDGHGDAKIAIERFCD